MGICIECEWLSSTNICGLQNKYIPILETDILQSECEILAKVNNQKHFNAEAIVSKEIYPINISRDKNKLILEFEGKIVPTSILSKCNFNVSIKINEDEIGCCNNCDICITPIC